MDEMARPATPAHLWIVGGLGTLWNAFGAYDYVMTRTRNTDYLKSMMPDVDPQAMLAWVDGFPIWAQFGWGLGVWGGLLGSLLLLAKNRYAFHVLLLSLIGCVISLGWQMLADTNPPPGMDSSMNTVMPLIIIAVAAGLFLYARAMRAKGVLR